MRASYLRRVTYIAAVAATAAQSCNVSPAGEPHLSAELRTFAQWIGLEQVASDRYSLLLVRELLDGAKAGTLNPYHIVHEIRALEGIGLPSELKPPKQNKHPPLKGLWHKHYMEVGIRSLAMNVKKGLDRHGIPLFEQKIGEAKAAGEERNMSAQDIPSLVNDIISGSRNRLAADEALTGEWLIFAKHDGNNYYLCLTTHDSATHYDLRRQIDEICRPEFPFLSELLERA